MKNKSLSLQEQEFSKNDWLNKMFRKSESYRTEKTARVSLRMFDRFCVSEGLTEPQMIEMYQTYAKNNDIRSICLSLDKFIQFLGQDRDEITLNPELIPMPFKKKSPKTIKTYFAFVKSYLRICHGVRVSTEDIKDYVTLPRLRKEPRKAIPLKTLKVIFNYASPRRRALYYVLISSGMRISEALSLKKHHFHLDEDPIRITLDAETTKTKEGRETYITNEAFEKLKPLLEDKKDDDRIFIDHDNIDEGVHCEDQRFHLLRKKLGLLEKYPNSSRYVVNIHGFRAYFHTKASQKHGPEYANALDGHGAYLKQYYRETDEERAKKYKELEPSLYIESFKPETEKKKDDIIENLQAQMLKLQDEVTRIKRLDES